MSQAADGRTDLVRACLREPVSRTPVWFMRQAGRALPEYRAVRGTGSILSAFGDASLSAEVTLQPVRRYGVDAAILFSDIVVPLHAIGFGVDWRVPLDEARRRVGGGHALQGNLDPALCLAPWPVVADASRAVLAAAYGDGTSTGTGTGHIFNLGHGVLPETDPGILAAVVELVHNETATENARV